MRFLRYLLPVVVVAVGFVSSASAECRRESYNHPYRTRDFEAVQEYVNSKRTIPLEEKACNLAISGDIRFEWAHITESIACQRLRGQSGIARQNCTYTQTGTTNGILCTPLITNGVPFGNNEFDVEFNLYFDYVCDRAWGVAWLQFNNDAGTERHFRTCCDDPQGLFGSGCCDGLCLKKAYLGYNLCADGCNRLDIEIGRRPLYNVFDSRVQFNSRFDGVLLRYGRALDCWGDFYWNLGGFVVDERSDHYAFVTEAGLLNIFDSGLDFKYSLIDWRTMLTHDNNRCFTNRPIGAAYIVSQFTLEYEINPEYLCFPAKIYGAFLVNTATGDHPRFIDLCNVETRLNHKNNQAWYVGFIVGEVCREGDWSIDANYQYVQEYAVPQVDVSGIGSKNNVLGLPYAFTNYQGFRIEGLYALTDNLTLDSWFEYSQQIRKVFYGKHKYTAFLLQGIYAF
jgi:hypothetical protein